MQRDDGALGPLGKCNKSDDHHSYAGEKGTTDYTAETILACFPEDRSGAELGTCSLTRTCPMWEDILPVLLGYHYSFLRQNQDTD